MKNRVTYTFLGLAMLMFTMSALPSCTFFKSLFEDKVITLDSNVMDEHKSEMIPLDQLLLDNLLTDEAKQKLKEEGRMLVLVDKAYVKDQGQSVDITDPSDDAIGTILDIGLGIANTVLPGVAAIEGLGLLVSKRKRHHYANAARAIAPTDGSVDIKEALASIVRGMGYAHTRSDDPSNPAATE